jgi:PAS domain S-box-containing protein
MGAETGWRPAALARPHRSTTALRLAATPQSAPRARRFVTGLLRRSDPDFVDADVLDTVALLVSETVTNAVLHAHSDIEVIATVAPDHVRVAVRDGSALMPMPRYYDEESITGRGLGLVEMLASGYGIESVPGAGKAVWFTVGDPVAGPTAEPPNGWHVNQDGVPLAAGDADAAGGAGAGGAQGTSGRDVRGSEGSPRADRATELAMTMISVPVRFYQAMQEYDEALLREHALLPPEETAAAGTEPSDLAAAERAHGQFAAAVAAAVLASPETETVDVPLVVSPDSATDFARLQATLDAADALAARGRMLTRPLLPELRELRTWCTAQVRAQAAGQPGTAWPGTGSASAPVPLPVLLPPPDFDVDTVLRAEVAMVAADDTDRLIAVNDLAAAMLGWTARELTGRRVVDVVPHRLREAHVAGFARHLLTGAAPFLGSAVRLQALHRDGYELDVEVVVNRAHAPEGRLVFLATLRPARSGR